MSRTPHLPFPLEWLKHVTYATPNETEAHGLTGVDVVDELSAQKAANILHEKGVSVVIITLGKKGVFLSDGTSHGKLIEGFSVKTVDTTGAGDAFNGRFAHAISSGMSVEEAVQFGQAVAALSVTKIGTAASMPSIEEIKAFLKSHL